jgi:hypothetical protein
MVTARAPDYRRYDERNVTDTPPDNDDEPITTGIPHADRDIRNDDERIITGIPHADRDIRNDDERIVTGKPYADRDTCTTGTLYADRDQNNGNNNERATTSTPCANSS